MELYGRITKGIGGLYEVRSENQTLVCKARGIFRHDKIVVTVGDFVTVETNPTGDGAITKIHERKNKIIRPPIANLDHIFIMLAASAPPPDLVMADKLSCISVFNDINVSIIVTKKELDSSIADEIVEVYSHTPFPVFAVSALTGAGIDELREYLTGTLGDMTTVFAGASGVGKSTLMNVMFPGLELDTGVLSRKIERGRHTTRHVQLYPISELPGGSSGSGYIADTPGFSLLDFVNFDFFDRDDLPLTFPEFDQYLGHCRYTKCSHTKEDGCLILEAVSNGTISPSRHASFLEIYGALKDKNKWDKPKN